MSAEPWETGLNQARNCEDWPVLCDRPGDGTFNDWVADKHNNYTSDQLKAMDLAWAASRQHHSAKLRRIGWLDQKGRVYLHVPPSAEFDGGSLTPLLIDARD